MRAPHIHFHLMSLGRNNRLGMRSEPRVKTRHAYFGSGTDQDGETLPREYGIVNVGPTFDRAARPDK